MLGYTVEELLARNVIEVSPRFTLEELRKHARGALSGLLILRRGNRLSITPVTPAEWECIMRLLEKS
mgnify:CR=1 FL=1